MKRVVVGLSGGVDSSVAAWLLQQEGYEVIGLFMRNWTDDSVTLNNECPWVDDSTDAMLVAEKLGIPFQTIDFSKEYKERIVDYMFSEYEKGRTPNPDVLCNREIKFDVFLNAALQLGADFVATGHYCRKTTSTENGKTIHHLCAGLDPGKDQSYFLCQVSQEQLSRTLFPIGHLLKSEVREIARKAGLNTAEKKDSQGLCFIGHVSLPEFLQQQLSPKKGKVIEIPSNLEDYSRYSQIDPNDVERLSLPFTYQPEMGKIVGDHQGAHFYTIGQRKGLNIGGTPLPLFIIGLDTINNIVYVGQGERHPGLYRKALFVRLEDIHWIREDLQMKPNQEKVVMVRIRYRQPLEQARLIMREDGLYILFDQLQKGITPGQFAAWYNDDELLGSGVIHH